jgi:hypothetical protein
MPPTPSQPQQHVHTTLHDMVIIPRHAFERLSRIEACYALGLLVFRHEADPAVTNAAAFITGGSPTEAPKSDIPLSEPSPVVSITGQSEDPDDEDQQ